RATHSFVQCPYRSCVSCPSIDLRNAGFNCHCAGYQGRTADGTWTFQRDEGRNRGIAEVLQSPASEDQAPSPCANFRTSIGLPTASLVLDAQSSAASRSTASM